MNELKFFSGARDLIEHKLFFYVDLKSRLAITTGQV